MPLSGQKCAYLPFLQKHDGFQDQPSSRRNSTVSRPLKGFFSCSETFRYAAGDRVARNAAFFALPIQNGNHFPFDRNTERAHFVYSGRKTENTKIFHCLFSSDRPVVPDEFNNIRCLTHFFPHLSNISFSSSFDSGMGKPICRA